MSLELGRGYGGSGPWSVAPARPMQMDDRLFDDLARSLRGPISRKGFVRILAALAASGLAAVAGNGNGIEAKKRHHKHQRNLRDKRTCEAQGKFAICHCPPGQGGTHCFVQCET